ncbi:MAG TPA: BTAD domain-containing putative transcriptional regulator [Gaiellaceae bacterium]|nr:BTAD domain-containing putative transcriptional regulator [Gaiellaceae bacterium]
MAELRVHLLGTPRVERDGRAADPPRGNKAWGLLAYLVQARVPPSRDGLAALLFPEADDPLAALRWSLSTLRGLLGEQAELGGDPVRLTLRPGTFLDLDVLSRGLWTEAIALPGLGCDLLDGLSFRTSPGFENWLENERRHLAGTTAGVLHEAALALLAGGEAGAARDHAAQLVRLSPYDENAQVLLVRCLRATGDSEAARRQVAACRELFERELGVEPSAALAAAAAEAPLPLDGERASGQAAVQVLIEAGTAAVAAGAAEAGVARLRAAVAAARRRDDAEVLAGALVALGSALVHSSRGSDEEGASALQEGSVLAERSGRRDLAATGRRELGWIQVLRGRYDRAEATLARASGLAEGNEDELGRIELALGTCRSDVGDYAAAARLLGSAIARLRRADAAEPLALAQSMLARLHLLRGDLELATALLDETLELADTRGLMSFRSWPESFRAEIDLLNGDLDAAERGFEHAFALGCEVGDPCWESIAARGRGLVAVERGDVARGLELLATAPRLCRRLPDTYLWIEAYGLDALCTAGLRHGADAAPRWVGELEAIAARRGLRELLARASVYRTRFGDPGALAVARSLAAEIDNPLLAQLVASAEPGALAA